jgi:hypothetical protein
VLGVRLRAARETLNQSTESAADAAGLTLKTYERYEQGRIGRWATAKMLGFVETWNISLDWLLEGTGTMFCDGGPPQLEPSRPPQPVEAPPRRPCAGIRRACTGVQCDRLENCPSPERGAA